MAFLTYVRNRPCSIQTLFFFSCSEFKDLYLSNIDREGSLSHVLCRANSPEDLIHLLSCVGEAFFKFADIFVVSYCVKDESLRLLFNPLVSYVVGWGGYNRIEWRLLGLFVYCIMIYTFFELLH